MNRLSKALTSIVLALCVVKPAAANFIYDINTNTPGVTTHEQFTVASILTSVTTVTSFTIATSSMGTIQSVVLDPVATGACVEGGIVIAGPCLGVSFSGVGGFLVGGFPVYTSTGTFVGGEGVATIMISAVPEPATLALLGLGLFGLALARRRQ